VGLAVVLAGGGAWWYRSCRPQAKIAKELNQGIVLYQSSQFPAAIALFQKVVTNDPTQVRGWLYLGASYAQQFVPGGVSPENGQYAMRAIEAFEGGLKADPGNKLAMTAIGNIYYEMGDIEKAREWEQKRQAVEPDNPDVYYWVGVLDWDSCFRQGAHLRESLGISSDLKVPLPEKARAELEKENGPLVEEGMKELTKALQLQANFTDAMVYMNLMYRQKAELERDATARTSDLTTADAWVDKALEIRRASEGVTPMPAPADKDFDFLLTSPPPPPPPPPTSRLGGPCD
jgi:tetratricopeptide (TPR) repeat protein